MQQRTVILERRETNEAKLLLPQLTAYRESRLQHRQGNPNKAWQFSGVKETEVRIRIG